MKLEQLIKELTCINIKGELDKEILGVAYDSRKVGVQSAFVCIKGFSVDGHKYIHQAIKSGATALIVEDDVILSDDENVTLIKVDDTRKALSIIAAQWFGHPASKLHLIGITGTKGKTTTSNIIKAIFEENGDQIGMIGTMGAYIAGEKFETCNTTPESYELQELFSKMVEKGCKYAVMEVSSQALLQGRTRGLIFEEGIFMNVSEDHIGTGEHEHKDFEEYVTCKQMLFDQSKLAIVNIDDPSYKRMCERIEQVHTFSCKTKADLMARNIDNRWELGFIGTTFELSGALSDIININMAGAFNVQNSLASIMVGYLNGISLDVIKRALQKVSVKGRMQLLTSAAHLTTIIIDYAHNALSVENLLSTLKEYKPRKLICMFGSGGNRVRQRRYDMGSMAAKYADLIIVTTDNPRDEAVEDINKDIIRGIDTYQGKYEIILDRKEAIHYLIDHSTKDDIIVFIGKGHEEYQEIKGVKYEFSEEKIVEEYIKSIADNFTTI